MKYRRAKTLCDHCRAGEAPCRGAWYEFSGNREVRWTVYCLNRPDGLPHGVKDISEMKEWA